MKKSKPRDRISCRFHDPSTFGPVAFLKPSGDILSNNESPIQSVLPALSEGIFESNLQNQRCLDTAFDGWQYAFKFLNLLASEFSSLMSHRGVAMLVPGFCISRMNLFVSSECASVRDTKNYTLRPEVNHPPSNSSTQTSQTTCNHVAFMTVEDSQWVQWRTIGSIDDLSWGPWGLRLHG